MFMISAYSSVFPAHRAGQYSLSPKDQCSGSRVQKRTSLLHCFGNELGAGLPKEVQVTVVVLAIVKKLPCWAASHKLR